MFSILGPRIRLCDGINRRELLRVGGLAFTGLAWPLWSQAQAAAKPVAAVGRASGFGKAKRCILIYSYGGPSHIEILDPKPDAPKEIRGEFQPIATRVPGFRIGEHLPRLAQLADRYSVIRSMTHRDNDHAIGAYLALTGYSHPRNDILGIEPPASPQDMPSMGSVISKVRPAGGAMFSYVTLGELRHLGNHDSMGQDAGCLGRAYDPFIVPFERPGPGTLDLKRVTSVMEKVDAGQIDERRRLFGRLTPTERLAPTPDMRALDRHMQKAFDLLASPAGRDAFDLDKEPTRVRERYGPSPFAQNCLRARRLIGAGVPLVTVYSFGDRDWDTHSNNFQLLKNSLLPPTDRGLSALLEDLEARGMLGETLVVWMSEMGRTPRINNSAGRDHWSFCYSVMLAGGGIVGGQIYGSSDRSAAYPSTNPVKPADLAATIFHCLGIDARGHVTDQQGRPFVIGTGQAVAPLLG